MTKGSDAPKAKDEHEEFKAQVEAHLAAVSRDQAPHPVDLAHAVKFILETMLRGL